MVKGKALLISSSLAGLCAIAAAGCGDSSDSGRGNIDGTPGQTGAGAPAGAAPTGATIFAAIYGDEGQQTFGGSAVDAEGNVYVVGQENQNRPDMGRWRVTTPEGRA